MAHIARLWSKVELLTGPSHKPTTMKNRVFFSVLALVTLFLATACTSTSYMASSAQYQDDLYATHNKSEIERQLIAENQRLKAQLAADQRRSEEFEIAAAAIESREADGIVLTDISYDNVETASTASTGGVTNVTVVVEPKYAAALYGSWAIAAFDNPWYYDWNDRWLYSNFYYRPYWSNRDWRYFHSWNSYCYYNPFYYYSNFYHPRPYYPSFYRPHYSHYVKRNNVNYGRPYVSGNSYSSNKSYSSNSRNPITSASSSNYRRLSTSAITSSNTSTKSNSSSASTSNTGVYRRPTSTTYYRDAVNETRSSVSTSKDDDKKTTNNSSSYRRSTSNNSSTSRSNTSTTRSTTTRTSTTSTRSNSNSNSSSNSNSNSSGGSYRR